MKMEGHRNNFRCRKEPPFICCVFHTFIKIILNFNTVLCGGVGKNGIGSMAVNATISMTHVNDLQRAQLSAIKLIFSNCIPPV